MSLFTLPHIESSPKRVRVLFGGQYIIDTTDARLVYVHSTFIVIRSIDISVTFPRWIKPQYPYYFFNAEDLSEKYLTEAFSSWQHQLYDIAIGDRRAEAAVTKHLEGELNGLISIDFEAMDAWFEEDEQIFVHPKDPYKVSRVSLS